VCHGLPVLLADTKALLLRLNAMIYGYGHFGREGPPICLSDPLEPIALMHLYTGSNDLCLDYFHAAPYSLLLFLSLLASVDAIGFQ